ncbi:MAG: lipase [Rhodococcus sp.]|nr:lipase [Rhodococcus sp. (in: high G+C Gram-positive bacteria)]
MMAGVLLAGTVACGSSASGPDASEIADVHTSTASMSAPSLPPAPIGDERGAVLSREPFAGITGEIEDTGATVTKVTYRSTSGVTNSGTEVVGTVFTPEGQAPEGGWPVVTVGHGTTGVTDECAPSSSPTLLGTADVVGQLLERGYVVAVSDYEGLGTEGPHPYLEPTTAAYNLIDAVRAARQIVPAASTRWAALGVSQGGQASWSAAEHADDYGEGLEFVGSANLSPAADLAGIADGNVAEAMTLPQKMFLPYLLEGLQLLHPEMDPTDYLRGALAENPDTALSCVGAMLTEKWNVATQMRPDDTVPRTPADALQMRKWLEGIALPQSKAAGPQLVVVGSEDNLIFPEWTEHAVEKACANGDVIAFRTRTGEGHADARAIPGAVQWVADRFAGVPPENTCQEGGS